MKNTDYIETLRRRIVAADHSYREALMNDRFEDAQFLAKIAADTEMILMNLEYNH